MKSLSFLALALVLAPALFAERLTPDAAIRRALAHQPELAAARLLVDEARARREQSGRLSQPELETEIRPHTNGREGTLGIGLTQRFPLTSRLRAERAVSEAETAAAEAELRDAEQQLAQRTALVIADWLTAGARLELTHRQFTNAQAFAANLEAAADRGEVSRIEVRQLTLEAGQIALRRRQIQQEQAALRGELCRLLNLSTEDSLEVAGSLPMGGDWSAALIAAATNSRPEIRIAQARIETARRETRLARAQRWHDVGVGLVSEMQRSEDQPDGIRRDDFVGLRLSVPLPFWNRNQGRIRETETRVERRQLELKAMQLRIRTEQEAARETLAITTTAEREWREVQLPLASELEQQLLVQREQGQASFTDWARARERRLHAEADHLESRRDLLRAWLHAQAAYGRMPQFPPQP